MTVERYSQPWINSIPSRTKIYFHYFLDKSNKQVTLPIQQQTMEVAMEPKIGDFVVRKHNGEILWSMTGIITSINNRGSHTAFYTIHWNQDDVERDKWQTSEFEVIA